MRPRRAPRGTTFNIAHLQAICVLYVLTWCLFPPLAVDLIWRIALAAAFAGWFALEALRNNFANLLNAPALWVLVFMGYTGLIQYHSGGWADVVRGIQLHICLLTALIGIAYRGARWRELEWLIVPVLALVCVSIVLTVIKLHENPHAARIVVRTSAEAVALLRAGVGGYQLVYACAVLAPILLLITVRGWRIFSFYWWAVALTFCAAITLVLAAGYTIAVLVVSVASALALLPGRRDGRSTIAQAAAVCTILAIGFLSLDTLLADAEDLVFGTKYAKKVDDLRQSIDLGQNVGTASNRVSRYVRSLELFVQSPVIGVLSYDSLGKHSQIIDTFARYGMFIGVLGVFVLIRLPGYLISPMPRRSANAPMVMMTRAGIFLVLNNATAAHGAVAYLLAPTVAYSYGRRAYEHAKRLRPPISGWEVPTPDRARYY